MVEWCTSKKEQAAFCRIGLHSWCCRRMCIPQNAFDKYRNKKLRKDCQTPRYYLWLRKVLRSRLDEIRKETVRKRCSFLEDTLSTLLQVSVTRRAWAVGAELNGAQWDWLCSLMSPLLMQSLVADFTCICHTLIQDFTCFEPDRIFLSDRSTIPNEMCLEGVLWPRNIGKLKFLSIVNLLRTLLNSENSF